MKKIWFKCDKCGTEYDETNIERVEVHIDVCRETKNKKQNARDFERYHYCSEECFEKRMES